MTDFLNAFSDAFDDVTDWISDSGVGKLAEVGLKGLEGVNIYNKSKAARSKKTMEDLQFGGSASRTGQRFPTSSYEKVESVGADSIDSLWRNRLNTFINSAESTKVSPSSNTGTPSLRSVSLNIKG